MAEIDLIKNSSFESKMDDVVQALADMSPADGFSPSVTMSKVDGTATITAVNKTGTQTINITDGVSITGITETDYTDGVHTISVSLSNGNSASFQIKDGKSDVNIIYSDSSPSSPKTDMTWIGNK